MSQKYCTACGAALPDGLKFCEHCGSPVVPDSGAPVPLAAVPGGPSSLIPPVISPPDGRKGTKNVKFFTIVFLFLVVAAGVVFFVLPELSGTGTSPVFLPGPVTTAETIVPIATVSMPASTATTSVPAQKPDPFPGALRVKEQFPFGAGPVACNATVYRYWINNTYQWHNDKDNHYYEQSPGTGYKYLFVFVHLQNSGDTRVWFPPAGKIIVYNNGVTYTQDQNHFKPDKSTNVKATPVEIKEVQYFQKLNGDEYAEDFGFSHGTELAYLYPGGSNAVDGYVIYEVPQSLTPEETYVAIPFNAQDQGVWKLG